MGRGQDAFVDDVPSRTRDEDIVISGPFPSVLIVIARAANPLTGC